MRELRFVWQVESLFVVCCSYLSSTTLVPVGELLLL